MASEHRLAALDHHQLRTLYIALDDLRRQLMLRAEAIQRRGRAGHLLQAFLAARLPGQHLGSGAGTVGRVEKLQRRLLVRKGQPVRLYVEQAVVADVAL
ncbi:hypothetical protein D3C79_997070 [compost metagenome]